MQILETERLNHLLATLETQRPEVTAHSRRVSVLAVRLASQYGLASGDIEAIRVGALLHDVGKLFVEPSILAKGDTLTWQEWEELSGHPDVGVELADRAGAPHSACEIVLHHHERYDGQGYPDRLASSAIPWPVRIVSVMDAFDTLTMPFAHREPMSLEAARAFIARRAGSQFCPWVVSGLISLPVSMLETSGSGERHGCVPDGVASGDVLTSTEVFVPSL
jgi:putative nucleotidyltransferase with HDIG domain